MRSGRRRSNSRDFGPGRHADPASRPSAAGARGGAQMEGGLGSAVIERGAGMLISAAYLRSAWWPVAILAFVAGDWSVRPLSCFCYGRPTFQPWRPPTWRCRCFPRRATGLFKLLVHALVVLSVGWSRRPGTLQAPVSRSGRRWLHATQRPRFFRRCGFTITTSYTGLFSRPVCFVRHGKLGSARWLVHPRFLPADAFLYSSLFVGTRRVFWCNILRLCFSSPRSAAARARRRVTCRLLVSDRCSSSLDLQRSPGHHLRDGSTAPLDGTSDDGRNCRGAAGAPLGRRWRSLLGRGRRSTAARALLGLGRCSSAAQVHLLCSAGEGAGPACWQELCRLAWEVGDGQKGLASSEAAMDGWGREEQKLLLASADCSC